MADLQKAKLYTSEGDPKTQQWYTRNGFHAVPLSEGQIPQQLALPSGQIDATPSITTFALLFFKDAKYMLDVRVAPLVAGVIVTKAAWDKLSQEERAKMLETAKGTEDALFAQAPGLDTKNINEMTAAGLQVITLDGKTLGEFRAKADAMVATQRGQMMSAEIYDWAVRERNAFRKAK
jgi:TRAP-type C4-dicarboxylate transport system substrate-binding protein